MIETDKSRKKRILFPNDSDSLSGEMAFHIPFEWRPIAFELLWHNSKLGNIIANARKAKPANMKFT